MNSKGSGRSILYLIFAVVILVFLASTMRNCGISGAKEVPITDVISLAKKGEIGRIEVKGEKVTAFRHSDGPVDYLKSRIDGKTDIIALLIDSGVKVGPPNGVAVDFKKSGGSFLGVLLTFLPLIFFGGLILWMMRSAQGTNNNITNFTRSRNRMVSPDHTKVTFADVAGVDEAKY